MCFGVRPHLYPGVPVVCCGGPGVDDALVVEAGQAGAPALQAHHAVVDGGGRELGGQDPPAFHPQQSGAA